MKSPSLLQPAPRRFHLHDQVSQFTMGALVKSILEVEEGDLRLREEVERFGGTYEPEPIRLFIDSYGGECYAGSGLVDVMMNLSTPVNTIVTGCAMSMGVIIALAGHQRFCYPGSTFMIHQVSSYAEGKLAGLKEDLEEATRLNEKNSHFIISRTKIKKSRMEKNYRQHEDWYICADEALRLGMVHQIIKK